MHSACCADKIGNSCNMYDVQFRFDSAGLWHFLDVVDLSFTLASCLHLKSHQRSLDASHHGPRVYGSSLSADVGLSQD